MQLSPILMALGLLAPACAHAVAKRQSAPESSIPIYRPIPPAALGDPIGPEGYAVESFGYGHYMVTEGAYQVLFVVSTKGVIVVDCPPTIGQLLLYAIGNITDLPITHLIYSHSHADHIGAAILLVNDKVKIIAHAETAKRLAQVNDPNRPVPHKTFKGDYNLKVGNQTLELSYKGVNHLEGNIFIYSPAAKVLMLVDVIDVGWIPFDQLGQAQNVPGFIEAHDQILAYDFQHFVAGHLRLSGLRADVEIQKEYVLDLFNNCADVINRSATDDPVLGPATLIGPVAAANPDNVYAVISYYQDATAAACAEKMNERWLDDRLAGADVFQVANAMAMIASLRLDYGILGPFGLA